MNPIKFLQNMTAADVQRYVRIILQWIASALVTHGMISASATWVEPTIGFVVGLASLIWTVYGTSLTAKLADMAALANRPNTPVQGVVLTATPEGQSIAANIDGPIVAAGTSDAAEIAKP